MDWILGVLGALFIFGGAWFYALSILGFFLLVFLTEVEADAPAGIFFLIFVAGVSYFNAISFDLSLLDIALYLVYYIALGCAWSLLKWVSFLYKTKDRLAYYKSEWFTKRGPELSDNVEVDENGYLSLEKNTALSQKIPADLFSDFAAYLKDNGYLNSESYSSYGKNIETPADVIPNVTDYKGKVTRWIAYWPMSAFWTILNDPLRRVAEWLFNILQELYRKIANAVFSNVEV